MKKTTALLLGSAAAMATVGSAAFAATGDVPAQPTAAQSYAELLEPVPNAMAALKADDARLRSEGPRVQLAQFRHHHHHHHHHHHGYFGFGIGVPGPYYASPTGCYWTYGRPVWNGFRWVRRRVQVCD
ncbi:MAG TPA: hypothetical protein VFB45_26720 [Pseudolabrys sp.]|nr:hypothetical protein [Pseudolabrys sp.]